MKKSIMKVLYICSMFFLFNSCEQENDITTTETPKDGIATFHATISKTRTTGNNWDKEDSIGIYALTGGDSIPGGIFDEKANIKYETKDGSGFFTAVDTDIMLPSGGTYDFVAYYPYQSDMTNNIYQIDISNQANQGDIDLLYSDNAKGHTYDKPNAKLDFNHMLSMITLNITAEDDVTSLENATVKIINTSTMGTFNLSSKEISITKDSIATITPNINCTKEKATASAILLPGQQFKETTVVITVAGKDLEWTPQEKVLLSGKNYLYNIKVTTQGTLETEAAKIIDWDNETVEEDIDFILKPGDDNSNNGGGNPGGEEGGKGPEVDPEPEPEPAGELLFPGADFEYKSVSKLKEDALYASGAAKLDEMENYRGSKSFLIDYTTITQSYEYIAAIAEEKLNSNYKKISFYIKGKSPSGISIALLKAEKTTTQPKVQEDDIFYNVNNETMSDIIMPTKEFNFKTPLDTEDKWMKITLNIDNDVIPETNNNRNALGIFMDSGISCKLNIDYITIE